MADTLTDPFGGGQQPNDLPGQWGQWLEQPGNRQFLLQAGLALAQPTGLGQTPLGHVAQAVGEGGEALTRIDEEARKDEKLAETAASNAEREDVSRRRLGIQQQNANTRSRAVDTRAARGGISATSLFNRSEADKRDFRSKMLQSAAKRGGPLEQNPEYRGKTPEEIAQTPGFQSEFRRAWDSATKGATAPQVDTSGDTGDTSEGDGSEGLDALIADTPAQVDPLEGRTATDPRTGKKKIRRGGKWVDL